MVTYLIVGIFLRMDGPHLYATAKEKKMYKYPTGTPGQNMLAFGAYIGHRDLAQDLAFEYRGAHYAVVVDSLVNPTPEQLAATEWSN